MKKENENISQAILDLVKMIPSGRVTSYGAIAKCLGTQNSARLVGWTLSHCTDRDQVPAHRVVNRNGLLTGRHHFVPPERMQALLEREGVKVVDHQVMDFQQLFWDPIAILNQ